MMWWSLFSGLHWRVQSRRCTDHYSTQDCRNQRLWSGCLLGSQLIDLLTLDWSSLDYWIWPSGEGNDFASVINVFCPPCLESVKRPFLLEVLAIMLGVNISSGIFCTNSWNSRFYIVWCCNIILMIKRVKRNWFCHCMI